MTVNEAKLTKLLNSIKNMVQICKNTTVTRLGFDTQWLEHNHTPKVTNHNLKGLRRTEFCNVPNSLLFKSQPCKLQDKRKKTDIKINKHALHS